MVGLAGIFDGSDVSSSSQSGSYQSNTTPTSPPHEERETIKEYEGRKEALGVHGRRPTIVDADILTNEEYQDMQRR